MSETPGTTVRPPRQARGHRTRERILAATERLLKRKRFEDVTLQEIVRQARSSVGSFYHLFGSKEALVGPLYARYDARLSRGAEPALDSVRWVGRPLRYRVSRILRYTVRLYRSNRGLVRALVIHARAHPQQITTGQRRHRAALYDRLTDLLLECRDEIAHPQPDAAIRLGLLVVGATCRDKILFEQAPHPRSLTLDDRALARELSRVFLAYLQTPEEPNHVS